MSVAARKNNVLSLITASTLGLALLLGLHGCGGGGGSNTVVPGVTLSAASISEGNTGTANLDFTVTLSEATTVDITVDYATSDDTATAGQDYTATSGTLTVPANSTSATISVPVTGDVAIESDESFNLQISNASKATIANSSLTVNGTINTDDLAGYYTGNIAVNGPTLTDVNDIKVIAADDRLVIINLTDQLVYIAPFESFSDKTFSTTASVYKGGNFTTTTQINGTFIDGASMDLTLAGTGDYTTGTITLAYSDKNSVAPLVFNTPDTWTDGPTVQLDFSSNTATEIITGVAVPSTVISDCDINSVSLISIISASTNRIRAFTATNITFCNNSASNGETLFGYFTTFDNAGVDNRILFVWFNDNGVHAASLIEQF